jgi:hypothetical protein
VYFFQKFALNFFPKIVIMRKNAKKKFLQNVRPLNCPPNPKRVTEYQRFFLLSIINYGILIKNIEFLDF